MNRRELLKWMSATALIGLSVPLLSEQRSIFARPIPKTGEMLPAVGFGTSRVFDLPVNEANTELLQSVLATLFDAGGSVIDTSSVYGRAEKNIGKLLESGVGGRKAFLSTKVLAKSEPEGFDQIKASFQNLKRKQVDLFSIHNLASADVMLPVLKELKQDQKIRYIGASHYSNEGIDELTRFVEANDIDFIQFQYTLSHRYAEKRLLDLAADKGLAVVINQPFGKGMLFQKIKGKSLPLWGSDLGIESWAQFFLKFIISHPSVNCVIPGTGKLTHAVDNVAAGLGHIPTLKERQKMLDYWNNM